MSDRTLPLPLPLPLALKIKLAVLVFVLQIPEWRQRARVARHVLAGRPTAYRVSLAGGAMRRDPRAADGSLLIHSCTIEHTSIVDEAAAGPPAPETD